MRINKARFDELVGTLLRAFLTKEWPYNLPGATAPQIPVNMPKTLKLTGQRTGEEKRRLALYLFHACYYMRGGIQSDIAFRSLSRLFDSHLYFFLPEKRNSFSVKELTEQLQRHGLGFNTGVGSRPHILDQAHLFGNRAESVAPGRNGMNRMTIPKQWMINLERLADRWSGNPLDILRDVVEYEEACTRIANDGKGNGFIGFQEKMVSMLIYFLMDAGFVDPWNFPLPVDFHVLRFIFEHEILTHAPRENGSGLFTATAKKAIRELSVDYCRRHPETDPLHLTEIIWIWSRELCSEHAGNQSIVGQRNGRKTKIDPVPKWDAQQMRAFDRTCERCPISNTCKWCIPSALYYIQGRIEKRGRRGEPPAAQATQAPLLIVLNT